MEVRNFFERIRKWLKICSQFNFSNLVVGSSMVENRRRIFVAEKCQPSGTRSK